MACCSSLKKNKKNIFNKKVGKKGRYPSFAFPTGDNKELTNEMEMKKDPPPDVSSILSMNFDDHIIRDRADMIISWLQSQYPDRIRFDKAGNIYYPVQNLSLLSYIKYMLFDDSEIPDQEKKLISIMNKIIPIPNYLLPQQKLLNEKTFPRILSSNSDNCRKTRRTSKDSSPIHRFEWQNYF